jgi:hypothetical protein
MIPPNKALVYRMKLGIMAYGRVWLRLRHEDIYFGWRKQVCSAAYFGHWRRGMAGFFSFDMGEDDFIAYPPRVCDVVCDIVCAIGTRPLNEIRHKDELQFYQHYSAQLPFISTLPSQGTAEIATPWGAAIRAASRGFAACFTFSPVAVQGPPLQPPAIGLL